MNQLTNSVLKLQDMKKGTEAWDTLFSEVFLGVQSAAETIVNSYAYSLKGDVDSGFSLAMEHIEVCTEKFNYQGFEFLTFYKKTLNNKLIDLVRATNAEKVRHMTSYEVSLSATVTEEGGSFGVEDRFTDSALQTNDSYDLDADTLSISSLLEEYAAAKPKEAELVHISMMYSSSNGYKKQDLGQAIADFFGEEEYTNTLQQRMSRATKRFKKFASEQGYVFNF
ncbi:hypothetical protein [Peribacillus muralis]|uniref:hypothetical protein n=1 Tax=Peribacillus muralis TaxID=264697 RepID=UPI00366B9B3D